MNPSRRTFLKSAAAGTAGGVLAQAASQAAETAPKVEDPTVSKRTGPYGKGLPITLAGYEYSRVKAIVDGTVQVKGCQSKGANLPSKSP